MQLLSRAFASEYATWLIAPYPFLIPWMVLQYASTPIKAATFLDPLHIPPDWSSCTFLQRLAANIYLWLVTYTTAWIVFHLAHNTSAANWKYNPKAPPLSLVCNEIVRSLGGVAILTGFQVFILSRAHSSPDDTPLDIERPSEVDQLKWSVLVALWADLHFYVVHRVLHQIPRLYKMVHKVHHRSINTDPWSGLSMHPVEHVLYFSAALLVLVLPSTPFWVTNLLCVSLIIYPVPAHIGYWPFEKHHWEHHTEFNYNYGSSMLWDVVLGTCYQPALVTNKPSKESNNRNLAPKQANYQ